MKCPAHEAGCSPLSYAEAENLRSVLSLPPYTFMAFVGALPYLHVIGYKYIEFTSNLLLQFLVGTLPMGVGVYMYVYSF